MAITSGRLTITSTPALIVPDPDFKGGYTVVIQNLSNSKSVYLDGANVTSLNGFELCKGATITVPIAPDEGIYGVTNGDDTAEICYLVSKR